MRNIFKQLTTKSEDQRTNLLKKNILYSFLIKGWSSLVQLILVPLTLNCLNQYEYGIWLTINSLLIWIDTFDIGLGNGLRNNLTIAIAQNNRERGRKLVSTTLVMLTIIVSVILFIVISLLHFVDAYKVLNVDIRQVSNLNDIIAVSIALVAATFIFKFIGNIYLAMQLPAVNNLIVALGQTVSLLGIYFLSLTQQVNLIQVAVVYTASPLLVYLCSYPITFTKYSYLRPSLQLFDRTELKSLFSLGIRFFIAQIAGLVIFASSNLIISHIFSPKEVTPYQIVYRYFGMTNILFTLISAPLWSATTDAYTRGDWDWIKRNMTKMHKVVLLMIGLLGVMFLVATPVYHLWVGKNIVITQTLSLLMAIYMVFIIIGTCYSNMLCGFGKIQVLTLVTIIEAIIYIPLALLLSKQLGTTGIILALVIVNAFSAVTNKIQFDKIMHGTARGIWNK